MARGARPPHARHKSLTRGQLERAIPSDRPLLLDTTALAAYFSAEPTSPVAVAIIDTFVRSGRNRGIVSAISAAELQVRPLRSGRHDVTAAIRMFLRVFPNVEVIDVDLGIAFTAAELRARENLSLPDALIAATGLDARADLAISDDARWPQVIVRGDRHMRVVALGAFLPFS